MDKSIKVKTRRHTHPCVSFLARIYKGLKKYLINYYLYIMYEPRGGTMLVLSFVLLSIVKTRWSIISRSLLRRCRVRDKQTLRLEVGGVFGCGCVCAERKPNEPQRTPRIPTETCLSLIISTKTHAKPMGVGRGVVPLHCDCGSGLGLWLVSLRSPLGVPYRSARNGGVGSGECG